MKVNITIPVYNEVEQLTASIGTLTTFVSEHCRFDPEIVIADNGSIDGTGELAKTLCHRHRNVHSVSLPEKGRGRALKTIWAESEADILSYMDVDLSTDLTALPPLIEALISGGFDLATGSRLLKPSLTTRRFHREVLSQSYNLLVKALFQNDFSDAQCGFKAITRRAARALLPLVEDNGWFFDTELYLYAEKAGYRIFDLPVRWVDDTDSRVRIVRTAYEDVKGLIRVKRRFLSWSASGVPVAQYKELDAAGDR